LEELDR